MVSVCKFVCLFFLITLKGNFLGCLAGGYGGWKAGDLNTVADQDFSLGGGHQKFYEKS